MRKSLLLGFFALLILLIYSCNRKANVSFENSKSYDYLGFTTEVPNVISNSNNSNISIAHNFGMRSSSISVGGNAANSSSASANISVTILKPVNISQVRNIGFDDVSLKVQKTKLVNVGGVGASVKEIKVPKIYNFKSNQKAVFVIDGERNFYYEVEIPKTISFTSKKEKDFLLAIPNLNTTLNAKKLVEYQVGAKIYINSNSASGNYYSNNFNVTVHLN